MAKDIIVLPEPFPVREEPIVVPPDQGIPGFEPPIFIEKGGMFAVNDSWPCAFDGLPPGIYGLVCHCPRCSPRCVSTS